MRFETSSDRWFSNDEPSEGGHCDQRHIGAVLCVERTNISQKFKAILLRQSDIGQNNIWAVFSDCLQPLESIWTGKDFGSVSLEKLRDAKQSVRIIFYDDDRSTARIADWGILVQRRTPRRVRFKLAQWFCQMSQEAIKGGAGKKLVQPLPARPAGGFLLWRNRF
jgi:hypothetical protein